MGNVNGREGTDEEGSNGESNIQAGGSSSSYSHRQPPAVPSDSMPNTFTTTAIVNNNTNTPPHSPARSVSPLLFAPQVPVAPLQRGDGPSFLNQIWRTESSEVDHPPEQGIPTIISWNYGGNEVFVEGSWDNWMSRKQLQRSGKDYSILLVLPSGIYHYKFIVDGEWRYIPELPCVADEMGRVCNLLDVNDYVPENLDSVAEFEVPPSPDSTYSQSFPTEEDFAKEPLAVPQQLHLTVLGMDDSTESSSSKPQHVVLNHLFIEKGWASQSLVALGLTHRFESKFVTVVLYKPLKR
ncbi:hypothetical protein JCGZ_14907 [Jatropha curcas]|uniref:Association with the SNF1 complex (ASC) domain-containing protein n=1 Tax=Jatropha curcas TaxID=180498 RepID=A0A067LMG3_JATCU|nr:SNF1-related protein kinase regulatory subunit beta-1 [Jatropha curcas]KDP46000.1 hypothetical protein JCGZ_14907 [Jatropha curcas]